MRVTFKQKQSKFKMNSSSASYFSIFVTGQIESARFPLGPDASELLCRYEVVAGPDWELVSGIQSGITQSVISKSRSLNDNIVFNMPIELTYNSTSPFGWPQMILSVYGKNCWGVETALGYCRLHIPVIGTQGAKEIRAPIILPKCSNSLSEVANWISDKNPELKNPSILAEGSKNKGLSTESYGEIIMRLNTISRGGSKLGYDWGQQSDG